MFAVQDAVIAARRVLSKYSDGKLVSGCLSMAKRLVYFGRDIGVCAFYAIL
jgi:hypothetical protein